MVECQHLYVVVNTGFVPNKVSCLQCGVALPQDIKFESADNYGHAGLIVY